MRRVNERTERRGERRERGRDGEGIGRIGRRGEETEREREGEREGERRRRCMGENGERRRRKGRRGRGGEGRGGEEKEVDGSAVGLPPLLYLISAIHSPDFATPTHLLEFDFPPSSDITSRPGAQI